MRGMAEISAKSAPAEYDPCDKQINRNGHKTTIQMDGRPTDT